MRSTFLCVAIACVLVAAAPATVRAAPPGKSDVVTDKARELHVEADTLYKQGEYARARVSYIAAWALKKHWQIAESLGDTELKLGLYRDAAEHLAYFMRTSPKQPPPPEGQKLYKEARSKVGTLVITVDAIGADVVIDGKLIAKAPLEDPVFVEPGHHGIGATFGEKVTTIELDIAAGAERPVKLTLTTIGGGARPQRRSIVPGVVLGSVAGAALVTGIAVFAAGRTGRSGVADKYDAILKSGIGCVPGAAAQDPRCDDVHSAAASHNTLERAGVGLMIGAGAAAVATGVFFLLPPSRPATSSSAAVHVVPALAPSSAGLVLSGAF